MNNYKLLTPGPLTTTDTVKKEMLFDHCTWDDDYKEITQKIRRQLLELAHAGEAEYTAVLMQGSGTFGVEAVLSGIVGENEKLLIVSNGSYGERMADIAKHSRIPFEFYQVEYNKIPKEKAIEDILQKDPSITHVAMVHIETTSGIINDIEAVARAVKARDRIFIVDAMSSFGGVDIPVKDWGIDFLISSANKCIQGVPGFSFILARKSLLIASKGKARSLSLDLYDQWEAMEADGKWRFTSPTHTVLAFSKAIDELVEEGGITARNKRYRENNRLLIDSLKQLGIQPYIEASHQGPVITTFFFPENGHFTFGEIYRYIKKRGYAIYPGKVTQAETFRIGNIGEIYREDIEKLCRIIKEFLEGKAYGKN